MAILEARGFTQKDFARYHPSGAIGRAMLVRIGDIMRSGDRNPLAPANMSVQEALLVMTRCRSGSLSVVDTKGRLVGVFTDGDLRRRMSADTGVLRATLAEVMTRNPIRISASALAAEALKIFNERNIDDLIVVDEAGSPVGVVDSQDLPKLKMM
jgi:arabinose-5-phosphate isomerase